MVRVNKLTSPQLLPQCDLGVGKGHIMKALVTSWMPHDKTGLRRPGIYIKSKTWLGIIKSIFKARKEGANTVIINWKDDSW